MTTVGEILKNKRLEKKLSVADVEKAIRVRSKFIEAIERNDFASLPPPTFTRGFIKNYASFIGLPVASTLAFYRRQENADKEKVLPPKPPVFFRRLVVTPALMTTIGVVILLLMFFGYLFWQYREYSGAPKLTVDSPADYLIVRDTPLEVKGETDPGAILKINDQLVTVFDNGGFDLKIDLAPGLNTFTFVVSNKFNKDTRIVRHVRLESP